MAYTEGTIKIDNNRTQFACTDSGPAKGQTLFLFHGISFDKRVFLKLFPLAQASNLRLVAINRRDYEPTSLYTDQETNQITKANADKSDCVEFYLERGREWAAVVTQFHDQHNLEGDCGVLAWSLGNQTLMAFLAALPTLSQEVLGKLQKCLKTVIMLDPPYHVFGFEKRAGYSPLIGSTLPPEEAQKAFGLWVSGYYDHKDVAGLELEERILSDAHAPSVASFQPADFAMINGRAGGGIDDELGLNIAWDNGTLREIRERALVGTVAVMPSLRLKHLWASKSIWECAASYPLLKQRLAEASDKGESVRDIVFQEMIFANHFPHWDFPEKAMEEIVKALV